MKGRRAWHAATIRAKSATRAPVGSPGAAGSAGDEEGGGSGGGGGAFKHD